MRIMLAAYGICRLQFCMLAGNSSSGTPTCGPINVFAVDDVNFLNCLMHYAVPRIRHIMYTWHCLVLTTEWYAFCTSQGPSRHATYEHTHKLLQLLQCAPT